MANTLRFKRGLVSGIPTAALGEPLFTTDTFDLYIGNGTTNTRFQKYIASGTTSQLLRGDGSLLTMPIVLTSPSNGQVLKYNGTSWVNDSDAGITGSGTTNYLPKFTGASTLGNSLLQEGTNAIGLGVTPSAWGGVFRGIQITLGASISGQTNAPSIVHIAGNTYWDSSNVATYIGNEAAQRYRGYLGAHEWYTAPTGTGGNPITFTQVMTLNASGNLGLGATPGSWISSGRVAQIGNGSFYNNTSNLTAITHNVVYGASTNNYIASSQASAYWQINGRHEWYIAPSGTAGAVATFTQPMTLTANGRLLLGTTTEGTQRLQVAGDVSITGSVVNAYNVATGGLAAYVSATGGVYTYFSGGVGVITSVADNSGTAAILDLFNGGTRAIRMQNGSVGIGTTSLTGYNLRVSKNITGSVTGLGVFSDGQIQSDVTSARYFQSVASTQAATFTVSTLSHFVSEQGTFGASSVVTSQYGFNATATLIGATNNFGFFGNIAAATGRWNFYAAGTALNYFNGNTLIGSSTTDSGEKLQVNGTMKVTGASTFGGNLGGANQRVANFRNSGGNGYIEIQGSGTTAGQIISDATGQLYFTTNATAGTAGTTRMFVSSAGDIGVGTLTPAQKLDVTGSTNSIQARFGNVAGRGLTIGTSAIAGTNDAGVIFNAPTATDGTLFFQTASVNRLTISPTGLATFSNNARFTNNNGLLFENASASPVGSIKMGTGATSPLEITNGTHTITLATLGTFVSSNLLVGAPTIGTSSTNTIAVANGTAPSSSATDIFHMYSADVVAGNAAPHFRTENGAVIKLYQQDNSVAAANYVAGIGSSVTTLDAFDGYTIGQVVKALRNAGILS